MIPQPHGLGFPPCGVDRLAHVCRPQSAGGALAHAGTVEVVSSLERDGRPVPGDLRWGVYVVMSASNDYVRRCFSEYGLLTDDTGQYAAMLMPAAEARRVGGLPIGLAHGVTLKRTIGAGEFVRWADVAVDETGLAVRMRREMERGTEEARR